MLPDLSELALEVDRHGDVLQSADAARKRRNVKDLVDLDWTQASPAFHRLFRFGQFVHTAAMNTFYSFSRLTRDGTDVAFLNTITSQDLRMYPSL